MLGQQIASLFVKLGADTRGLKKGMDEAATMTKRQAAKLEAEAKRAESRRNAILTGAAVAGLYMLQRELTKSVKLYLEAEKADIRLAQTIRSLGSAAKATAPELEKMTDELLRTTTFDDEKIKGAETVLLRFGNVRRDMYRDVLRLAADMAAVDGDLEGAMMSLARALEDPAEGIARLKREGVMFSDAQEKMIKKLMETGKIAEAQEIIMAKLNEQFGGQAQAQIEKYSGKLERLKRAASELGENIGAAVLFKLDQAGIIGALEALAGLRNDAKNLEAYGASEVGGAAYWDEVEALKRQADEWGRVAKVSGMAVTNADEYNKALEYANELARENKIIADLKAAKATDPFALSPINLPPPEAYDEHIRQLARVKGEYVDAAEAVKVFHETELNAISDAEDRANQYAYAVAGLSDTFFDMARNGKDAFQILADYFSRLVQSMISELVRLQTYKWFFDWMKPSIGGSSLATAPAGSYGTQGGGSGFNGPFQSSAAFSVNIIDQRMGGSPALSAQPGANGSIDIIVEDALTSMYSKGKLDKVMRNYGASRQVTVG